MCSDVVAVGVEYGEETGKKEKGKRKKKEKEKKKKKKEERKNPLAAGSY